MIKVNRFDYAPTLNNKKKGYIKSPKEKFLFGDEEIMIVPLQFKYRPDLISRYLYGTEKYAWLLAVINDFKNTPKEFEPGKEIIYTNPARLR